MSGPPPKPTALKKLAGNPGKRPLNKHEPRPPAPDRIPYAPRHLNDDAKREWRRMVKLLIALGLYTQVDYAALAMYCHAWGRWIHAERMTEEQGEVLLSTQTGNYYQNPWFQVANKAWDQMLKMLSRFGLSPADRARLVVAPPEEQDELAELFGRRVMVSDGR